MDNAFWTQIENLTTKDLVFQKVKVLGFWKLFKCDSSLWFSLETILFHNILFLCGCLVVKCVCDARARAQARSMDPYHLDAMGFRLG